MEQNEEEAGTARIMPELPQLTTIATATATTSATIPSLAMSKQLPPRLDHFVPGPSSSSTLENDEDENDYNTEPSGGDFMAIGASPSFEPSFTKTDSSKNDSADNNYTKRDAIEDHSPAWQFLRLLLDLPHDFQVRNSTNRDGMDESTTLTSKADTTTLA